MERFLPVPGFPAYRVSNYGRVRGPSGWTLKPATTPQGYHHVCLYIDSGSKNTKLVHQLVLQAFAGPAPTGTESHHKNGVKSDNRLGNLEWVTARENMRHAARMGLMARLGENNGHAKLTEAGAMTIRSTAKGPGVVQALARQFDVSAVTIDKIHNHRAWKHLHP